MAMPYKVTKDARCGASKPFGVVKETDNTLMGCHATRSDANSQMAALYANESGTGSTMSRAQAAPYVVVRDESRCDASKPFGVVETADDELMGCYATESDANDQMMMLNADAGEPGEPSDMPMAMRQRAPIEFRSASVDSVNHDQRIITVLAVPWESPGTVLYRGEVWNEIFVRGAFNGLESMPNRVKANRDHDKTKPIGKAINFWPGHDKGLLAEIKVSKTWRGDETLALADDHVLGVSVGYAAPADREHTLFDRKKMERRVIKAYLDHISFVTDPAFVDAQVVSVRERNTDIHTVTGGSPFPNLNLVARNDFLNDIARRLAHGE